MSKYDMTLEITVDEVPDEATQRAIRAWAEEFQISVQACITKAAIAGKAGGIIPASMAVSIIAGVLEAEQLRITQNLKALQAIRTMAKAGAGAVH